MTFGTPTTLDVLLNALSAQLVANTTLLPEQVRLTLETEEQIDDDPTADQFLTIAPAEFPVNDGAVVGGGSSLMETDGTVEIQFYARYEADYYHAVSQDKQNVPGNPWFICTMWRALHVIAKAKSASDLAEAVKRYDRFVHFLSQVTERLHFRLGKPGAAHFFVGEFENSPGREFVPSGRLFQPRSNRPGSFCGNLLRDNRPSQREKPVGNRLKCARANCRDKLLQHRVAPR